MSISDFSSDIAANDLRPGGAFTPHQPGTAGEVFSQSWRLKAGVNVRNLGGTAGATCEIHSSEEPSQSSNNGDRLIVRSADLVTVSVWSAVKEEWLLWKENADTEISVTPGPLLDRVVHESSSPFETAYKCAQRHVNLPEKTFGQAELDWMGLKKGDIPAAFSDWTFLGRFQNHGDLGGGWTYAYLLKVRESIDNAKVHTRMKTSQVYELLGTAGSSKAKETWTLANALALSRAIIEINKPI